jgi:radical SAM protein with 4Fe4S-binding SPASM domain
MKRLILFGAGENGKKALEFWGAERVECYVDNNLQKVGQSYCGKKIISFEELCSIWKNYEIMVTANCYGEIAEQLKTAGVSRFSKFMIPDITRVLSYLREVDQSRFTHIALYGADEYTIALLRIMPDDIKQKVNHVIDDRNHEEGHMCLGYNVKSLDETGQDIDAILITSPQYHIADENHLQKRIGKHVSILNPFKMRTYYSSKQLVVNKYLNESNEIKNETQLNEKNRNRTDYFDAVRAFVDEVKDETPLFKLVEIETINRCNGSCEFCPVNRRNDTREKHIMSEDLFHSIIDQLEKLAYSGRISLFSNNEPFLDERIWDFSKYMREHLPRARIHMFTNGTLLTLDKFKQIIPFLDEFILDNYTQDLHLIKPAQEIKAYCEDKPELISKVTIVLRKPKELLSTRGGSAPNRKAQEGYPEVTCAFPFQQLIIRPTGQVSLCCNDALGKYTLGDLSKEGILDVWHGNRYKEIRKAIAEGRKNIEICRKCDVFSLYL